MERVAEPELMETKEQVISYSEADFSEGEDNLINQIDYYLLKNKISLDEKDLIVDLGCGPGNISEKLATRWPNTEVADIKNFELSAISQKKEINLLVSNSLIHHLTHLDDFFKTIVRLSNSFTVNFHKDLKRPLDEKSALELKTKCSSKYNNILTNDYYASLKASYTYKELKDFLLKNNLLSMEVFEDCDQYLIVYGKV